MSNNVNIHVTLSVPHDTAAAIQNPHSTTTAIHEQAISELSRSAALAAIEAVKALPSATSPDDSTFQVGVVLGTTALGQLDVRATMTIMDVKKQLQQKRGILPEGELLMHEGRDLEDERTLEFYEIEDGGT